MERRNGLLTVEQRRRRRQRLAAKSPETRRRRLQYSRRHNEKDGQLLYCDYCDLFVSSVQRSWMQHLTGVRHMEAVEAYYVMVEACDPAWLNVIREDIVRAHTEEHVRQYQLVAGKGAAVPLPPMVTGFVGQQGIVVGGTQPPHIRIPVDESRSSSEYIDNKSRNCTVGSSGQCGLPSVRVGGLLVAAATPPVVRVNGKLPVTLPEKKNLHQP